jgi:hypothetical protein
MSKVLLSLCAVCLLVSAPALGSVDWDLAGSGNWATATNWTGDACPLITESVTLPDTVAGAGYTVTINSTAVCSGIEINIANTHLLLTAGGDFTVNGCMTSYKNVNNGLAGALFEQTGGTSHISGYRHTRWGNNYGSPATIKISGGTVLPAYLTFADPLDPAHPDTGKIVDCGYRSGSSATRGGTLHVVGSEASITMLGGEESSGYGAFQIFDYGIIIAELDAGGVSTINVDLTQSANLRFAKGDNADLAGGTIDMRGVTPNVGDSFTLLTADVIDSTGIALDAADAANWTLTITTGSESGLGNPNNGDNGSMVVTYVPEPATLSLLAIGGVMALIRRRRA